MHRLVCEARRRVGVRRRRIRRGRLGGGWHANYKQIWQPQTPDELKTGAGGGDEGE